MPLAELIELSTTCPAVHFMMHQNMFSCRSDNVPLQMTLARPKVIDLDTELEMSGHWPSDNMRSLFPDTTTGKIETTLLSIAELHMEEW